MSYGWQESMWGYVGQHSPDFLVFVRRLAAAERFGPRPVPEMDDVGGGDDQHLIGGVEGQRRDDRAQRDLPHLTPTSLQITNNTTDEFQWRK